MVESRRRWSGAGTNPDTGSPALAGALPPFAGVLAAPAICSRLYPRRLQSLILFTALFCFILMSPGKSRRGAALSHGRALIFLASSVGRCWCAALPPCAAGAVGTRGVRAVLWQSGASPPWGLAVPCADEQRPKLQKRWRSSRLCPLRSSLGLLLGGDEERCRGASTVWKLKPSPCHRASGRRAFYLPCSPWKGH